MALRSPSQLQMAFTEENSNSNEPDVESGQVVVTSSGYFGEREKFSSTAEEMV